jgi:hypothetical protein
MATGIVDLENIVVTFTADMVQDDYGVPGSPVWEEPDNVEVAGVEILGVDVPFASLPDALQNEIMNLSYEVEDWT